ncbi:MAG: aspartate dehydrogenase domain-containing protein [Anaerocolumna sp.]
MKRVGFLGCGKIGGSMLNEIRKTGEHRISFVQDPFYEGGEGIGFPVIKAQERGLLEHTDLVIETAAAEVLKENIDEILKCCDLMVFSVTAFSEDAFYQHVLELIEKYNRKLYLPHGAILGVDGIADGNTLISSITIETTKNPESLGRTDKEYTIVYEGNARDACKAYPRNVNVHATIALAGIGFDKTRSRIISDPSVSTNTHKIIVEGEGIHFELQVSSFSTGGVTGKYTPYSAVASMHRVLDDKPGFRFV